MTWRRVRPCHLRQLSELRAVLYDEKRRTGNYPPQGEDSKTIHISPIIKEEVGMKYPWSTPTYSSNKFSDKSISLNDIFVSLHVHEVSSPNPLRDPTNKETLRFYTFSISSRELYKVYLGSRGWRETKILIRKRRRIGWSWSYEVMSFLKWRHVTVCDPYHITRKHLT